MNGSDHLKYVRTHLIVSVIIASFVCTVVGAAFIIIDLMGINRTGATSVPQGGFILVALGIAGLSIGYFRNVTLTISRDTLSVRRSLWVLGENRTVRFGSIESVEWNPLSGDILIVSNQEMLKIPSTIARVSGDIRDQSDDPEIPAGGPTRETFNLFKEIQQRVSRSKTS